ncbi:MAG: dehydrogenase [Gemmatimonadetes bacterium]|nr:dehydrogenase [Gemmatimonadota bacterium]MBT7453139.1 dehydrogenase [Gemmatimonadota bacterium]
MDDAKPTVNNWQINREMDYQYEDHRPNRQIAYIFDTNKCIECQTCTIACKTTWTSGKGQEEIFWNNVETKPYGGYPQAWDMKLLEMLEGQRWNGDRYEGKTVFENLPQGQRVVGHHPTEDDYGQPNLGEDEIAGVVDGGQYLTGIHHQWMFYLARICNHCTYPACLAACPRKAIYKREEDGIVLVDESRCRGYQECVKACPYKKVFYNAMTRTSEKCIGCYPRVEQGLQPRCVESCIGKIRLQGWLSKPGEEQADNPIDQLVHIKKIALPLYPQYGTEPNVYYIPPIHVPRDFLLQMFGPGVETAIENYMAAKNDMAALASMMMFGNTPQIITRYEYDDTHATGYNEGGDEVVKVPMTEPFIERNHYDEKYKAYRLNTA